MSEARLSSKGQITVPRDIRERLKLKLGDKMRFRVADNGQIVVEAARYHVGELYGLLRRKGRERQSGGDDSKTSGSVGHGGHYAPANNVIVWRCPPANIRGSTRPISAPAPC